MNEADQKEKEKKETKPNSMKTYDDCEGCGGSCVDACGNWKV